MEATKSKMSASKSKAPIKAPVKAPAKENAKEKEMAAKEIASKVIAKETSRVQMKTETTVQAKKTPAAVASHFGDVIVAANCSHCGADEKAKKREISATAWQALVDWQEVSKETVDKAICQSCYNELREILIERADEIAAYAAAAGQRKAG